MTDNLANLQASRLMAGKSSQIWAQKLLIPVKGFFYPIRYITNAAFSFTEMDNKKFIKNSNKKMR